MHTHERAEHHADPVRVGMVGLGVIGAVHAAVLDARPDVRLVFLADRQVVRTDIARSVPRFRSLGAALRAHADVDIVVVATPTDTHLALAAEVLESSGAMVLSEKPVSRDATALWQFQRQHAAALDRVRTVNHFAFSPEVVWAVRTVSDGGWGPPDRVLSCFDDPYAAKTADERRTYVSSWVDSGANQLAMLARFSTGWSITAHEEDAGGMRSVTDVAFDGGSATLTSNWWTGASSKQTIMRWAAGHELFLDHTSMTGLLLDAGRVREHFGNDGTVDRKTAHYSAMYHAVLDGTDSDLLGLPLAAEVAGLLSTAAAVGPQDGGVGWSVSGREVIGGR